MVGAFRERAVFQVDRFPIEVVDVEGDIRRRIAGAGHEVDGRLLPVTLVGAAVITGHFSTLVVLAQDDIDNARDGVRPIDRGGAVLEYLDSLHRTQGDTVQVDERIVDVLCETVLGYAPSVEKDKHGILSETAHVQPGRARCKRVREFLVERRAAVLRQLAQHFRHGGSACGLDRFTVYDQYGRRSLDVDAFDVGTGYLDLVQFDSLFRHRRTQRQAGDCNPCVQGDLDTSAELVRSKMHVLFPPLRTIDVRSMPCRPVGFRQHVGFLLGTAVSL